MPDGHFKTNATVYLDKLFRFTAFQSDMFGFKVYEFLLLLIEKKTSCH
jgi:hypothetical protein